MPTKDVVCPAGHVMLDVFVKKMWDRNPACETCGEPTQRYYLRETTTRRTNIVGFQPVFHEGVGWITSEDELRRRKAAIAANTGCSPDEIVVHRQTKSEIALTADDARHRAWERNQKKGLDAAAEAEVRRDIRRHGVNPFNNMQSRKRP